MTGHRYIALRVLPVQTAAGIVKINPGEEVPVAISNTWPETAVRSLLNQKRIDFLGSDEKVARDGLAHAIKAPAKHKKSKAA